MRWPGVLVACVAVLLAARTHTYASAWRSNVTLWQVAVQEAPFKPRPWVNYGAALVTVQRFDDAHRAFTMALIAAELPHVPAWDADVARTMAGANLRTLQRMGVIR